MAARRWLPWALAWLVLSLVAVPLLGRVHQVVHGGALHAAHAAEAGAAHASGVASDGTAQARADGHGQWLARMLAGHAPADCLLLDQLALGETLHSAALALPEAVPAHARPVQRVERRTALHAALFQARGPPRA